MPQHHLLGHALAELRRILQRGLPRLPSICTACLLAWSLSSSALDPSRALTQYGHDVWTDQDGLPQNSIQALVQTSDGYVWMGTQEGLVRFDGLRFTVYDRRNTPAMTSNNVLALCEDHEGTLWAGMEAGGAVRLKRGKFEAFGTAQGLSGNKVVCLMADRQKRLWFGLDGSGLNLLQDGRVRVFGAKEGLKGSVVYKVIQDHAGTVWAGTNRGIFAMDGGVSFREVPLGAKERNWYYDLAEDGEGVLWIGTLRGLYALRDGLATLYQQKDGLCDNRVMALLYDSRSEALWVGTTRGLNRFRGGRFDRFTVADGLSHESVSSLATDAEGNLWVGTNHGLNQFRDGKFYTVTSLQGLPSDTVLSVCEGPEGSLWVGTDGGGIARVGEDGSVVTLGRREGLPGDVANSLCMARDGILWAGFDLGGMAAIKNGRATPLGFSDPIFATASLTAIVELRGGGLWVASGNGLFHIAGGRVTHPILRDKLGGRSVNCLLELASGDLAIGTDGAGLVLYRGGATQVFRERDGLGSDMVYALYEDGAGTLWIGTGGGVSLLRKGRFSTVSSKAGLFDDTAYSILQDGFGSLWMSCNKGVYRARKADMEAVADGRLKTLTCWSYGRADGMGTNECNGGVQPSACKMKDGRLCFATMKGVAIINPAAIRLNDRPPPVVIEEVFLDGRDAARFDHSFPPGKHRVELRFSALSLVAPDKVRFKYKMEGFDSDWVDGGSKREAVYTGLPPGPHRFRVIACNNDGVWNETGASYAFTQAPHIYQTGLFLILCIAAGLLLVSGLVALRVGALKRRQAALEHLVEERTVELAQANQTLQEHGAALQVANLKLERLSKEDGLTGIANRRHFEEGLDMEWRRGTRTATPLSIIMIDIDEFKAFNDALGHQRGDECLRRVAGALAGVLNRAGDLVARYGGDEFVAVLPTVDAGHAQALGERLRQCVEGLDMAHATSHGLRQVITISVGVATAIPTEGGSSEALLAEADRALYLAKDTGRNRVCSA